MYVTLKQVTPAELARLRNNPSLVKYDAQGCDIDKAWHTLHFLLGGDPWGGQGPLARAILGGVEIGEDMGYGPAKYLTPELVRDVAVALAGITKDELRKRFNIEALNREQIYPGPWEIRGPRDEKEIREFLEFVLMSFDKVTTYYRDAASKGNGMLAFLI